MTAIITPSQDSQLIFYVNRRFIKIIEAAINFHPGFRRGYSKFNRQFILCWNFGSKVQNSNFFIKEAVIM